MTDNHENLVVPPYTNRGVQNTSQDGLIASVDWLSFTLLEVVSVPEIISILGLNEGSFIPMKSGQAGYKNGTHFNGITILTDGKQDMGSHIIMSGEGCRTFENNTSINIYELLHNLSIDLSKECNITRLDIAVDDFKGYFTIKTLLKYLKKGHVTSKFKMSKHIENIIISTGEDLGHTLYFGRPTSSIQIRFYEKNIEQHMKGNTIPKDCLVWNRTEIQARDERAEAIAYLISQDIYNLGYILAGICKQYVQFRKENKSDSNKSRWEIAKFWSKFLGDVEPLRLAKKAPSKSIERSYKWIDHSVTKSLAMLFQAFGEESYQFIEDIIEDGEKKLTKKEIDLINRFKLKEINYEDFIKKIKESLPK